MGIGGNLRRLRNKTKFSQHDVADQIGVSKNTYMSWENENSDIKAQYIPKLAELFNVEIKNLFTDSKRIQLFNNYEHNGTPSGHIIINVTDKETAEMFTKQMLELLKKTKT
ncbi:helix-turn-helix domain-containing protein [Elizabethkingia meningoseptica]|uniref:helix-turn-helix domain-containing protein n=1 Tax=Elizabethkingia meningoseptica TaxID=238 RepID=UPI0038923E5C